MVDKRISELDLVITPLGTDELADAPLGNPDTLKITMNQISAFVHSNLPSLANAVLYNDNTGVASTDAAFGYDDVGKVLTLIGDAILIDLFSDSLQASFGITGSIQESPIVLGNRNFTVDDIGKRVPVTVAADLTILEDLTTVDFFPGATIRINRLGAGAVTIVAAANVFLNGSDGGSNAIPSQFDSAELVEHTPNNWSINFLTH